MMQVKRDKKNIEKAKIDNRDCDIKILHSDGKENQEL